MGDHGGGASYTDFERKVKLCLIRRPCLLRLQEIRTRLWKQASLSTGAPLGNLEGGSFTRDSERQMESSGNGAYRSLYMGALQG